MSNTMDIFCDDCKVRYWYAQTSGAKTMIYSPEHLKKFFEKHRGHKLHSETEYAPDENFNTVGYKKWMGHRAM